MYFFTVPWGKNLRSRCQHSHSPSEASREESFVACPSLWGCWHSLACDHTSLCFVFTSPSPLYLSFLLSQVPAVVTSLALPCSSFLNGELISAEEGVTLHYIPRVLCCDFPIRVFQGLHTALLLWKRHLSLKLEPTQINQDNLKIHNLITPAMTLFPNKLTGHRDLEIWHGSLWAGHFLTDHRHLRSSTKCTSELPVSGEKEERINPPHPSPVGQGLPHEC